MLENYFFCLIFWSVSVSRTAKMNHKKGKKKLIWRAANFILYICPNICNAFNQPSAVIIIGRHNAKLRFFHRKLAVTDYEAIPYRILAIFWIYPQAFAKSFSGSGSRPRVFKILKLPLLSCWLTFRTNLLYYFSASKFVKIWNAFEIRFRILNCLPARNARMQSGISCSLHGNHVIFSCAQQLTSCCCCCWPAAAAANAA